MAKRKRQPLQQLSLFDETTLRQMERKAAVKELEFPTASPKQKTKQSLPPGNVVETVYTVWGPVQVTEEMDFIMQECGYSSLEGFLTGEEQRPPRPPTKQKNNRYASKRVKGRSAI